MRSFGEYLSRGAARHGDKFDASDLQAVDRRIVAAYESGDRIRIETIYESGESWIRTGTIGVTTGWKPAFLLMSRSNSIGSGDVLGPRDRVTHIKRGRDYVRV